MVAWLNCSNSQHVNYLGFLSELANIALPKLTESYFISSQFDVVLTYIIIKIQIRLYATLDDGKIFSIHGCGRLIITLSEAYMAIGKVIQYAKLEDFRLDSKNPRLGNMLDGKEPSQKQILDEMDDWKLDELAVSFLSSGGFWVQEALLAIKEKVGKSTVLTVVEGNRRLAALMKLKDLTDSAKTKSAKWRQIAALASESPPDGSLFERIPYLLVESRSDVDEYLGFRHVTGIEEWHPAEKAAYIAKLIDDRGMSYNEVMRKIGSKAPTVRQHYIAHRLLCQMKEAGVLQDEGIQNRFSVMYLSLRTPGVQQRLGININAEPAAARIPVPKEHEDVLPDYARWLFGDEDNGPLFSDSRQVDIFGGLLESDQAFDYLRRTKDARFDLARRLAGGDLPETIDNVKKASEYIRLALSQAHLYRDDEKLLHAIDDFGADAIQLMSVFIRKHAIFRKRINETWS